MKTKNMMGKWILNLTVLGIASTANMGAAHAANLKMNCVVYTQPTQNASLSFILVIDQAGVPRDVAPVSKDPGQEWPNYFKSNYNFLDKHLNGGEISVGNLVLKSRKTKKSEPIFQISSDSDGASYIRIVLYANSKYTRGFIRQSGSEVDPYYYPIACRW